ncbi:hypothetical protein PtrEW4_003888 [Pyrenophora tritici-repentis]|nr:hypothetical protein PtrSN001A_001258 [Pyrenophora tritici-repentis]KAI1573092.1 hypothetical protein PtrEW4_003888 [Pyrenophora tritici-repentis]PWO22932.1 hypothetical protein PtrARCrB10_08557 [Pyrenophora tritici-repentis]
MAEEMVELGFEGLDRFANKYWDRTYDRLPEVPRPGRKKRQQQRQQQYQNGQRQQYLPQDSSRHPDKGYRPSHCPSEDVIDYESDPEMYGPDRRRDSYGREEGYYETGRNDYRAPGPGFKVPNARDEYNGSRGVQVASNQSTSNADRHLTEDGHHGPRHDLNSTVVVIHVTSVQILDHVHVRATRNIA